MQMAHHIHAIQEDLAGAAAVAPDEATAEAGRRLSHALASSLHLRLLDVVERAVAAAPPLRDTIFIVEPAPVTTCAGGETISVYFEVSYRQWETYAPDGTPETLKLNMVYTGAFVNDSTGRPSTPPTALICPSATRVAARARSRMSLSCTRASRPSTRQWRLPRRA